MLPSGQRNPPNAAAQVGAGGEGNSVGWSRRNWPRHRLLQTWPFLTPEQVEIFKEVFQILDSDDKGFFTVEELVEVMRAMGGDPNDQEVDAVLYELDANSDRNVDFAEFMAKVWDCIRENEILSVFGHLGILNEAESMGEGDQSNKTINLTSLERCFAYVGDPLNDTDKKYLEFMFQGADREGDGRVNFTEFMQHIEKLEEDLLRHAEDAPPTARRRRASIALLGEDDSRAHRPLNILGKLAPKALVRFPADGTGIGGAKRPSTDEHRPPHRRGPAALEHTDAAQPAQPLEQPHPAEHDRPSAGPAKGVRHFARGLSGLLKLNMHDRGQLRHDAAAYRQPSLPRAPGSGDSSSSHARPPAQEPLPPQEHAGYFGFLRPSGESHGKGHTATSAPPSPQPRPQPQLRAETSFRAGSRSPAPCPAPASLDLGEGTSGSGMALKPNPSLTTPLQGPIKEDAEW